MISTTIAMRMAPRAPAAADNPIFNVFELPPLLAGEEADFVDSAAVVSALLDVAGEIEEVVEALKSGAALLGT